MKRVIKYIGKFAGRIDISPFSKGGIIKLIIYFTWGLNASLFMQKDLHHSQDFAGEQIIIEHKISQEEFICEFVSSEIIAGKLTLLGSVYEHKLHAVSFFNPYFFSNRAPPLS